MADQAVGDVAHCSGQQASSRGRRSETWYASQHPGDDPGLRCSSLARRHDDMALVLVVLCRRRRCRRPLPLSPSPWAGSRRGVRDAAAAGSVRERALGPAQQALAAELSAQQPPARGSAAITVIPPKVLVSVCAARNQARALATPSPTAHAGSRCSACLSAPRRLSQPASSSPAQLALGTAHQRPSRAPPPLCLLIPPPVYAPQLFPAAPNNTSRPLPTLSGPWSSPCLAPSGLAFP